MNLGTCTPDQKESIQCVSHPLLISAGAGSGKTFTLTQRIAYALLPESGPVASDIDEILAITFTEKAASEIKARVKRTLRQEGLTQEALKVDGAWISTIHGMCSRILRAHALEAGVDPEFSLLSEAEAAALRDEVINEIIGTQDTAVSTQYGELFDEYGVRSFSFNGTSVMELLDDVLSQAASQKSGLACFEQGPEPLLPSELVKQYLLNYEEFASALVCLKQTKTIEGAQVACAEAISRCEEFLHGHPELMRSAFVGMDTQARRAAYSEVAELFEELPWISLAGAGKAKEHFEAWQMQAVFFLDELQLALARPFVQQLLELAREVKNRIDLRKRQLGKLDNDDLLTKTQELFERFPQLAERYENRFKLVMIDEFQDTSQLQVDMVCRMAGKNCAHLCTVGDAQQSIYRFRGADVQVYEAHKTAMRSPEIDATYIELKKNFRSHQDVLSFVDCIFSQPRSFGEAFMSLSPHLERKSRYVSTDPRINLLWVSRESSRNSVYKTADLVAEKARMIAERFAAYRAAGHRAGDMVVLLGKMTNASVYAQALRDAGFECVIAGGSLFGSAPEVGVIERLVQTLVNPLDGEALYEVLASEMIDLSTDELLQLASRFDEETQQSKRQSLPKGFARLVQSGGTPDGALGLAVSLYRQAQQELESLSCSRVVTNMVIRSGWLWRLEQQGATGKAQSANILKALRLLKSLEQDKHLALASLAAVFSAELSQAKEAPGSLSGEGDNVVKIMTIHASKGLEFPLVALAEFEAKTLRSGKLTCLPGEQGLYVSLKSGKTMDAYPTLSKNLKSALDKYAYALFGEDGKADAITTAQGCLDAAQSAAQYGYLLHHVACEQDLAEARRKLYVGLTRASEALVVAFDATKSAQTNQYSADALVEDIRLALTPADDAFFDQETYDYGGTQPAQVFCTHLWEPHQSPDEQSQGSEASVSEEASDTCASAAHKSDSRGANACEAPHEQAREFVVPATPIGFAPRKRTPYERGPVFSYSSISDHAPFEHPALHEAQSETAQRVHSDCMAEEAKTDGSFDATLLGSAFHRCAQFAVETGCIPDQARRVTIGHTYGLSEEQLLRLDAACQAYFASEVYAQTQQFDNRQAEVPFYVPVGHGDNQGFLEGEIDALCYNDARGEAFVVDYKTGGSPAESASQLHQKHLLQASCYAYALLHSGFQRVRLAFVRVEQRDEVGMPQVVHYEFSAADLERLEGDIAGTWHAHEMAQADKK